MRLKTNIFLWVSLATVLPLTLLVLGATAYSERIYREKVIGEVNASLNSVIAEIDRRLRVEREMVLALTEAPAMRRFFPVLEKAAIGEVHAEFSRRSDEFNAFLEAFQNIVPSLSTIRVLDRRGNTLLKVRNGRRSRTLYEGLEHFPYAEEELQNEPFRQRLQALIPDEVAFTLLPQTYEEQGAASTLPLLDAVVPLVGDGQVVGYLAASLRGEQIDRILDFTPRLHNGRLFIAELNPDEPERDGIILYDDTASLRFADNKSPPARIQDMASGRLRSAVHYQQFGAVESPDGRAVIHYMEYLPYPSQLVSWVVATRIDMDQIAAPFERIRWGIWLFAGVALLLSLAMASYGTRRLAGPVIELAHGLKAYADGDRTVRVAARGGDELRQLEASFNYMAETLERAHEERDRAQRMMLQSAKLASLGQMAAGIGHEINNPLNNILSLAKLMERGLPAGDERLRKDVASLREEALRATRIVRGILDFARQMPPQYSRFEVRPWVEESFVLVERIAVEKAVTLAYRLDADEHVIDGDRGQLQQVLANLLLNAIDASPAGGTVTVEVRAGEAELTLLVHDRGGGIEPATLDRVFDPFFTTKPVGEGTGLGLSISLGIVQRHGGQLAVTSNPEGGVTAAVTLPRAPVSPPDTERADAGLMP